MTASPLLPRVLLTNDDGFDAPGLAVLAEVARQIAEEVWIVAPHQDQSGMGQSITMNGPLRTVARGEKQHAGKQWAVAGTPADCVILGLQHLMRDTPPALVLSGVNAGENTGDDANLSGTIGAAFTALMLGAPAIGISLGCATRKNLRWDTARMVLPDILKRLLQNGWSAEHCLSVNIPDRAAADVKPMQWVRPARRTVTSFRVEKREDLREKDYFWIAPESNEIHKAPGDDVSALDAGHVSVTAFALDRAAQGIKSNG
ncbi:MAG: 5'/3'-nucleotidase SurE [Alphaproteobacteria bacterium]|nr:5'/3'-nucleotidase SurE [Alphaproteobacteria bacterium]